MIAFPKSGERQVYFSFTKVNNQLLHSYQPISLSTNVARFSDHFYFNCLF